MKVAVKIISAFSIEETGGNPAGVVFNADEFSNQTKQEIATKAGFPETAFISSSVVADYKLDFFTPTRQIPHCGHATIATFAYLKKRGKIKGDRSSKETIDGTRTIVFKNGQAFMEQKAPSFNVPHEYINEIILSLKLDHNDLVPGLLPTIVNTGNSFLIVPVKDQNVLSGIEYNREQIYKLSERLGLIGYYLYTDMPNSNLLDATTRMFAPFYGIEEEAATGMAAGPLAAYLYQMGKKKDLFQIEQGRFMKPASPSLIQVQLVLSGNEITRLFAGGDAYISGEQIIDS